MFMLNDVNNQTFAQIQASEKCIELHKKMLKLKCKQKWIEFQRYSSNYRIHIFAYYTQVFGDPCG